MNISPEYIAGFLDGEGCIQIIRQRKSDRLSWSHRLSVEISHTYAPIVDALHERYGGVRGSYPHSKNKVVHYWHATGDRAGIVLQEVLPYLIEKRPQAELGLEFLAKRTPSKAWTRVSNEEMILRDKYYWALRTAKR